MIFLLQLQLIKPNCYRSIGLDRELSVSILIVEDFQKFQKISEI